MFDLKEYDAELMERISQELGHCNFRVVNGRIITMKEEDMEDLEFIVDLLGVWASVELCHLRVVK